MIELRGEELAQWPRRCGLHVLAGPLAKGRVLVAQVQDPTERLLDPGQNVAGPQIAPHHGVDGCEGAAGGFTARRPVDRFGRSTVLLGDPAKTRAFARAGRWAAVAQSEPPMVQNGPLWSYQKVPTNWPCNAIDGTRGIGQKGFRSGFFATVASTWHDMASGLREKLPQKKILIREFGCRDERVSSAE
jgi:hypothetical protein